MRIGINLLNFDAQDIGGVGYYLKGILQVIQRNPTDGISYVIYAQRDFDCRRVLGICDQERFEIVRVPNLKAPLSRLIYKLLIFPVLIGDRIDVLFSPAPPVPLFINKKVRLITAILDLIPLVVDRKQGGIYRHYYNFIVKNSLRRSDKIVTISNNTKRDLVRFYGIDPARIECVYPFIAGLEFKESAEDEDYFMTVSLIQPGKNLERMVRAFAVFLQDRPDKKFKLYIVGKPGWGYSELYALPKKLGVEGNVIFTGYLEKERLDQYYRKCSALIYISLYEGFGMPPLEAMYHGKPSVVSDNSSLPEVVGDAGLKVNPLDTDSIATAMSQILDRPIRARLIANMPDQIAKYDAREQVGRLESVFKQVGGMNK